MRFLCQREMRPFSPAATREQSQVPSQNSRGGLTPFMQLKGAQRSPSQLKVKAEFPTTNREESHVPTSSGERAHSLLQLKRNPNFPSHHKRRPVSPIESRVEPHGSCCKETGCRVPPALQIITDSPAPASMEHRVSPHNRMGGL